MGEPKLRNSGIVDVSFGDDVTIVQPVNLYGCAIGEGSFIGPFVEIQREVVIGKRCRIQSHAFICELVVIGDDCFISHGAMFINDLFSTGAPAKGSRFVCGVLAAKLIVKVLKGTDTEKDSDDFQRECRDVTN